MMNALKAGAEILLVGLATNALEEVSHTADEFLEQLEGEEIDRFRIMTDF